MKVSDAYLLGCEAFLRGDDISLCPYDESDAQSDEWKHGWMDEYVESK
jgi:ribosome modulation factor